MPSDTIITSAIAFFATAGVILRPWQLPEAIWAVAGAVLLIATGLAEQMGGGISVESTVGKGSCFTLELPLEVATNDKVVNLQSKNLLADVHLNSSSIHILLAEDYEPNIMVASAILDEIGYTYTIARNGKEAVEYVKTEYFNLLLMDLQMPLMSGLEATQHIRIWENDNQKQAVPIIGVTAYATPEDRRQCLKSGMNDYVAKPYDAKVLQEKIAQLIKRNT